MFHSSAADQRMALIELKQLQYQLFHRKSSCLSAGRFNTALFAAVQRWNIVKKRMNLSNLTVGSMKSIDFHAYVAVLRFCQRSSEISCEYVDSNV